MTARRSTTVHKVLALACLTLLGAAAASARTSEASAKRERKPNILIFITDDQRLTGTLEVLPKTLSWFRDGGTSYSSAVTTTPTCCPARSSIFTGRYAHNHGVHTTAPSEADHLDQDTTLQRYLHRAGYKTALFGKYLNGWRLDVKPPSFDTWALFETGPKASYYGGPWSIDGDIRNLNRYSTDFIADQTRAFLKTSEQKDGQPWLLYVTPLAPHPPFSPAPKYAYADYPDFVPNPAMREVGVDLSDKPPYVRNRRPANPSQQATNYAAQVRTLMSVDDLVNSTMRTLEDLGEADNTLAIFISDNGYLLGEHGLVAKTHPYSPSIRVPLFVRWPGHVTAGAVDDRLVANIDLAPTIFEAVGIEAKHVIDGRSLFDTTYARDRILTENWHRGKHSAPNWTGLWGGSWQYVEHYNSDRTATEFTEYYDLVADPFQLDNLFGDADGTNDPDALPLAEQLARDASCKGTSGPRACP
ncbi:MAG: sulfatase family protein [Actinomycetota bacterium]